MRYKRLWLSIYLLILSTYSCFTVPKQTKVGQESLSIQTKDAVFFVPVPITKLSSIQSPCVDVCIDDKIYSMELDLGFRGDLTFVNSIVEEIATKTFILTKPMYGIRGKEYITHLYQIPKIRIGAMAFIQPTLQQDNEEFIADSVFVRDGGKPSPREPGRLGWELFYNVNLLVDVKNSRIAFCDSLETLKNQGYLTDNFTKVPLLIERGLIEFEANTPEGPRHCTLDTGTTWNVLNTEIEKGKSIEQVAWEPSNMLKYSSFTIGKKDFGAISFHRIPIKLPIRIEVTLGMEFFEDHLVFIDFSEKQIYFAKDDWMTTKLNKVEQDPSTH